MRVLVINSGSSSIKFQLFDLDKKDRLASGIIEEVGGDSSTISLLTKEKITKKTTIKNHEEGFLAMERVLFESGALNSLQELDAIGHRVVHGGKSFSKPILIDESVIKRLKEISPLAPLHNPSHIVGIEIAIRQSRLQFLIQHFIKLSQTMLTLTQFHMNYMKKWMLKSMVFMEHRTIMSQKRQLNF